MCLRDGMAKLSGLHICSKLKHILIGLGSSTQNLRVELGRDVSPIDLALHAETGQVAWYSDEIAEGFWAGEPLYQRVRESGSRALILKALRSVQLGPDKEKLLDGFHRSSINSTKRAYRVH